jgi:hypothetical protein
MLLKLHVVPKALGFPSPSRAFVFWLGVSELQYLFPNQCATRGLFVCLSQQVTTERLSHSSFALSLSQSRSLALSQPIAVSDLCVTENRRSRSALSHSRFAFLCLWRTAIKIQRQVQTLTLIYCFTFNFLFFLNYNPRQRLGAWIRVRFRVWVRVWEKRSLALCPGKRKRSQILKS